MSRSRARRRRAGSGDGIYDINMTPLIDVSLVLVVILMVATPLAFQSSIAVRTASAAGRAAEEVARADRVELRLLGDGTIEVNRVRIEGAALADALRPLLAGSASGLVVVHADDAVSHGAFVHAIDVARTVGARQIAVTER
jgi:biopolymer transport protein TolR